MAQKRMFDKSIIETDNFLDLPMTTKALYFLFGMEADDEGFVSPRRVLRLYGGAEDDVKVLITKKLVIPFKSGVVVITDWHQNNWLDGRRIKPTQYLEEKKSLTLTDENKYVLSKGLASAELEEKRGEENSIVEKNIYGEFGNVKLKKEEYDKLVTRFGEKNTSILIEELSRYLASKKKHYASHYATLLNWASRKIEKLQETKKRTIV